MTHHITYRRRLDGTRVIFAYEGCTKAEALERADNVRPHDFELIAYCTPAEPGVRFAVPLDADYVDRYGLHAQQETISRWSREFCESMARVADYRPIPGLSAIQAGNIRARERHDRKIAEIRA